MEGRSSFFKLFMGFFSAGVMAGVEGIPLSINWRENPGKFPPNLTCLLRSSNSFSSESDLSLLNLLLLPKVS